MAASEAYLCAMLVALGLCVGCSLSRFHEDSCYNNEDCRESFGFATVCNGEQLCQRAQPNQRCNITYPEDLLTRPDRYRDAVVFGSMMDRSSAPHVAREKSIRLATKEVNQSGNLDGRPIGVVFCDIQQKNELDALTRTEAAVASADYLANTLGVPAIIGPSASSDVQRVWQALQGSGTLVISPAATSPALTGLEPKASSDMPGLLWRTAPPDSLQGSVIADDMIARGVKLAYVIRETGAYGEGLAAVFSERFRALGGVFELQSLAADTDIGGASALFAAHAATEVLFISSQQEWVTKFLAAAASQSAYAKKGVFLTDAAANEAVFNKVPGGSGSILERIRGTRPAPRNLTDYVLASFIADFRAEYAGEDPMSAAYTPHSYDAAWLSFYGAAWSQLREGVVTGHGIGRGLRRVSAGTATPIVPASWAAVQSTFKAGNSVDVSGASGELNYDGDTEETRAPIEIWAVEAQGDKRTITHVATHEVGVQP
jgi:branched-chain amino acid transport system substrate-binding protein